MNKTEKIFDVAVIGGGPAGMMSAIKAGEAGVKVVLAEKNLRLGNKLLLTGKGRCNLANAEFDLRELVKNYGEKGPFFFHAFSEFGPKETIAFFEDLGMKTKIERGKRVFPENDRADEVLSVLLKSLVKNKVKVFYNSDIVKISCQNDQIEKALLKNGKTIKAKNFIICAGGKAYPETGSVGDGFKWLEKMGHKIKKPVPALVPIRIKESWVKDLQGLNLENVEIKVFQNGKEQIKKFGEMIFTHFGISGPIVLDISKKVGGLLEKGITKIFIDLKPALDFETLDKRIQRDFLKYKNKLFRNCLNDLLPQKIIPIIVKFSRIMPDKKANSITKEERQGLARLLKRIEMTPTELMGFNWAIVTNGGVSLDEIDHKTMKSKIIGNLFFAGEIIDIDGPTGGFNLQICWSTGALAGRSAAKEI